MITDRYRIGGTYISCTDPEDSERRIRESVANGVSGYICVSNPRTVKYATRHDDYKEVMAGSLMNLPDAEPMYWAAKLWGLKQVKRTMGPKLFESMLGAHEDGLRHFLLGDTEETLSKLVSLFAGEREANIAGTFSPPFCDLEEYDFQAIADIINRSGADIVWLSLRAPKQDFFAARLTPLLDKKICIGVGAAFRYSLGEYKMAPPIIKKLGLMGLYWGKKNQKFLPFIAGYLSDNIPFLFYLAAIPLRRLAGTKYNQ